MAKPENRKPQPISRHPLFPAIVALWFAALFGLGSLIVSPALIERIVSAAGIDKVLPMAAPPLGTTARILFALALTGLGGLVGLVAGRRVAQTAEEAPARMPFAGLEAGEVTAEPEAESAEEPARPALPRRRRAFALVAEDAAPLAPEEAEAPAETVSAEQPPILNLSELDLQSIEAAALTIPAPAPEERALETEAPVDAPIPAEWSLTEGESESESPLAAESEDEAESEEEKGPFGRIPEWLEPRQDPHPFSPARWAATREDADEIPEPAVQTKPEDLSNRLFEAYSRPLSENRQATEVQPLFAQDTTESTGTPAEDERLPAAERIAGAHLEDLSQVELLERLALAMEQERRRRAGSPGPDSTPPAAAPQSVSENAVESGGTIAFPASAPIEFPDSDAPKSFALPRLAPVADTLADTVAPFAAPLRPVPDSERNEPEIAPAATTRIPAALRPVGFDAFGHDDADDALPGYVPPRHIGLAPTHQAVAAEPIAAEDEQDEAEDAGKYAAFNTLSADFDYREAPEDDEEEAVLERGYSSLLNLTRQAPRQNFVRFDEPAAEVLQSNELEASSDEESAHRPFDPPARPDPTETEKALRAALATLQRMSGAA